MLPRTKRGQFRIIDMTGKRCGHWTVISYGYNNCNQATWLCRCDCGTERHIHGYRLRSGKSQSCGCFTPGLLRNRRGDKHPGWRGGRRTNKAGYVVLTNPEYPGKPDRTKWSALEHVVVMSNHLGRALLPNERVHHKNGVRDDNRIENLELWSHAHPYGQRVADKTEWALEWLRQYAPERLK